MPFNSCISVLSASKSFEENKKNFVQMPHFNRARGKDFELWPSRLMVALDAKDLSHGTDSPDRSRNDSVNEPEDRLTEQKNARSIIVRALGDNTIWVVIE